MITTPHGEQVYSQDDVCDLLMQGHSVENLQGLVVDFALDNKALADILDHLPQFVTHCDQDDLLTVQQFDQRNQKNWFMPDSYKQLDIAKLVLSLCSNDAELQRCGQELLLYQDRGLFDLLRYLKYLVDTMTAHQLIWGLGRGSSVASFVLYKLGVHRIDSMYYDLDVAEFLR